MATKSKEYRIIKEYAGNLKVQIDQSKSVRENMIRMYMEHYPDMSGEAARQEIEGLMNGIMDFNQTLSAVSQSGIEAVVQKFDQYLEGKSPSEKYSFYCNTLVVVNAMGQNVLQNILGSEKFKAEEELRQLMNTGVDCEVDVNEEDIKEVRQKVLDALENSLITVADIERLKEIGEDEESFIHDFAIEGWSQMERKAYLSLAAYLAYKDGFLDIDGQAEPYQWAVTMSAVVEAEETVREASIGRITWEKAVKILKGIGVVALGLGMVAVEIIGIMVFLNLICAAGSLLSAVVIAAVALWAIFGMECVSSSIIKGFENGFDRVKNFIEDNYEPVKEKLTSAWQFIREKITAGYICIRDKISQALSNRERVSV